MWSFTEFLFINFDNIFFKKPNEIGHGKSWISGIPLKGKWDVTRDALKVYFHWHFSPVMNVNLHITLPRKGVAFISGFRVNLAGYHLLLFLSWMSFLCVCWYVVWAMHVHKAQAPGPAASLLPVMASVGGWVTRVTLLPGFLTFLFCGVISHSSTLQLLLSYLNLRGADRPFSFIGQLFTFLPAQLGQPLLRAALPSPSIGVGALVSGILALRIPAELQLVSSQVPAVFSGPSWHSHFSACVSASLISFWSFSVFLVTVVELFIPIWFFIYLLWPILR